MRWSPYSWSHAWAQEGKAQEGELCMESNDLNFLKINYCSFKENNSLCCTYWIPTTYHGLLKNKKPTSSVGIMVLQKPTKPYYALCNATYNDTEKFHMLHSLCEAKTRMRRDGCFFFSIENVSLLLFMPLAEFVSLYLACLVMKRLGNIIWRKDSIW